MKIKSSVHAINLTIKRHQAVLDGEYEKYSIAVEEMKPKDWEHECPLCEFTESNNCSKCLWKKYTNLQCTDWNQQYDFYNDNESITRLKEWRKLELKEMKENKEA